MKKNSQSVKGKNTAYEENSHFQPINRVAFLLPFGLVVLLSESIKYQETNAMSQEKPQGPVVVIGGGVAGIQAALDLSATGFGVYIVEASPTLGGMAPKLHRIYPLCSCCKIDQRIVACEQDPNIILMPNTVIRKISGDPGHFSIILEKDEKEETVQAGAVILAAGMQPFEPTDFDTYAYGHLPNVITSVELEQMQKPLGQEQGQVRRPSDGAIPKKIAWLQCVGSRDINHCDAPYCSSVCCMYALKEARNIKAWDDATDTTIFFMDMRTHGKGFERYFNQAVDDGVQMVRSRVHSVEPVVDSDDLQISYADESGGLKHETFDLIVLSVGLRPTEAANTLARDLGLELNEDGYLSSSPFLSSTTNIPGIYACGGLTGPYDISQSLMQASSSVSEIISFLEPEPFAPPKTYPEPSALLQEPPRIFLAYHLCSGMDEALGKEIQTYGESLPDVRAVSPVTGDLISGLVEGLKKSETNRLVFASCTPVTHKSLLEEALRLAGLNPYLYEMVDLRSLDPQTSSGQIRDAIRMGVARAAFISAPRIKHIPVEKRALVVGGGVAGLESALAIARSGFPVTLVEKENELGGHANHVRCTWQGEDVQAHLKNLISRAEKNEDIDLLLKTKVMEMNGFAGSFLTTVEKGGKRFDVAHGVALLATGAKASQTTEYGYGKNGNVYTWEDLSAKLLDAPDAITGADSAVFIQCVGSREPARSYCSNFCCTFAVRTAVDLKTKNPDMDIYILYREMRTFGERETLYREAREKGVIFIRYDLDQKPVVESLEGGGKLKVTAYDPILGQYIAINADFISLQTAIIPEGNEGLSNLFHVELDPDGFFAEAPQKLHPMETSRPGVYFAGLSHYPKDTGESITQAKGAAAKAMELLKKDTVETGGLVAEVRAEKCAVCCTCVRTCPFQIPVIDHDLGAAYIDPALCRGCGMCVAECPGKAIVMSSCSDEMLNQASSFFLTDHGSEM